MNAEEIRKRLRKLANREKAAVLRRFFKTGPGQYGEGDVFLGITVPILRKVAKECRDTPVRDAVQLLKSPIHEQRLLALFLFIQAYGRGNEALKSGIYTLYLRNTRYINNWDLVDLSAPRIVGAYLADKMRSQLYSMGQSSRLWDRRIAIVATFHFIQQGQFQDTFNIARILLADRHDLIHKAVGWMLREVGKRDLPALEKFLLKNHQKMPRTMLRYAIERFPEEKRLGYLKGKIQGGVSAKQKKN